MRNLRFFPVIVVLVGLAACAAPPQEDIAAAKAALANASSSGDVVTYAPDAVRAAQEKMTDLDAEIAAQSKRAAISRRYDSAKQLAADAAQLARAAVTAAVSAKKKAADDAAALIEELTAALPAFQSKVWAARRVARIKMDIITPLQGVPEQIRAGIVDAQKDSEAGSYATARAKLMALRAIMAGAEETITEQTRIARAR